MTIFVSLGEIIGLVLLSLYVLAICVDEVQTYINRKKNKKL